MPANFTCLAKTTLVLTLVFLMSIPAQSMAGHVVSSSDLQRSIQASAEARNANLKIVDDFFSTPAHAEFLEKNSINPESLRISAHLLSDDELSDLAQKASSAQKDFAAGALSNRDLLLILLGIAIILLIIAVAD